MSEIEAQHWAKATYADGAEAMRAEVIALISRHEDYYRSRCKTVKEDVCGDLLQSVRAIGIEDKGPHFLAILREARQQALREAATIASNTGAVPYTSNDKAYNQACIDIETAILALMEPSKPEPRDFAMMPPFNPNEG